MRRHTYASSSSSRSLVFSSKATALSRECGSFEGEEAFLTFSSPKGSRERERGLAPKRVSKICNRVMSRVGYREPRELRQRRRHLGAVRRATRQSERRRRMQVMPCSRSRLVLARLRVFRTPTLLQETPPQRRFKSCWIFFLRFH